MSKYHSKQKVCNQGHKHASIKEKIRCDDLTLMEKAGVIRDLKQQPEFVLQDKFKYQGRTIRAIKYRADFSYYDEEKEKYVVEDVKGFLTQIFRIKKKMFLKMMKDDKDLEFLET